MDLQGKVCLITGGSSGIGAATAREFARRGADISICGLAADDALALEVKRDVEALGCKAVTITADVSDPAQALDCVRQTVSSFRKTGSELAPTFAMTVRAQPRNGYAPPPSRLPSVIAPSRRAT
jgi:NAD(P)-dependent dehydrogenase (short-subunit alcohol dehydrogenase family)